MRAEYSTRQRRLVQAFLERHSLENYSVDELVLHLNEDGAQIGRTTVYRTLEAMTEQGSVRKYQNAQGITQYQHISSDCRCAEHFHMLCSRCGKLYHVDCDQMRTLAEHVRSAHGFLIDPEKTVITGVCASCVGVG